MADRVSSDHESVDTIRATLTETATGVAVSIPTGEREAVPTDEVVRVDLDGQVCYARPARSLTGDERTISGVYETPDGARDPSVGTDVLSAWIDDHPVRTGGSVLVDVVEPGFFYGFRAPGETNYYEAIEPPSDSLADIAKELDGQ